jgi:phage virion morphogenesis protein
MKLDAKGVLAKLKALPPDAVKGALDEVAASQETEVSIRFERGVAPDGSAWAPLAAKTLKRRRGRGGGPLVFRGELSGSITRRVTGRAGAVGTNYETAQFHQFGTDRMPARPFIGWSAAGQDEALDIMRTRIARTVGVS